VNMDLLSKDPIVFNAPCVRGGSSMFTTDELKVIDGVLSHMDNSRYDLHLHVLERLVHIFHMRELWTKAATHYRNISVNPPLPETCKCVLDVDNNGIMKMLRLTALQIREPELVFGDARYMISVYFNLDTNVNGLFDSNNVTPPLNDQASWEIWKSHFNTMLPSDDFELAYFMYCALNKM